MKRFITLAAALLIAPIAACSSGAHDTPAVIVTATSAPIATAAPTIAPAASPTATPTPLPAVAPVLVLQAAPLTSTPTILTIGRSRAQSNVSLLPVIVEGAGVTPFVPGPLAVWVTNAVTGLDVAQTSGTVTGSTFAPLACPGASTLWCGIHPLAWSLTPPVNPTAGKQSLQVAFGDGTSGAITDDIYPTWSLTCNTGWAFVSGAVVAQATRATSDVYDDCVAGNIVFPRGGLIITNPVADQYGRTETILPTITAAFIINSLFTNAPGVGIQPGIVFGINTQDGGFAKIYFTDVTHGLALHANVDGTYAY